MLTLISLDHEVAMQQPTAEVLNNPHRAAHFELTGVVIIFPAPIVWREATAMMLRRLVFGIIWHSTAAKPFLLAPVRSVKGSDQSGDSRLIASASAVVRKSNSVWHSRLHTN